MGKSLLAGQKYVFHVRMSTKILLLFFFQVYRKIKDFEARVTSGFGIGLTANIRCHPPKTAGSNHENGNRNGSALLGNQRQTSVVMSSTGVACTATNTSLNDRRPRNSSLSKPFSCVSLYREFSLFEEYFKKPLQTS